MNISRNSKCRGLAVLTVLAMLLGLLPGSVFAAEPVPAQVVVPIPGPALNVYQVTVNDGAGGQTDPHVSGDWVSYTDNSVYGVRFQNVDLGAASDRLIPIPNDYFDSLSHISGNNIVFMRASGSRQGIYLVQIDPFGNPTSAVETSPSTGALRRRSAVGGDTIAYEDRGYDPSNTPQSEISLSSVSDPAAPAYRLTNDTISDLFPAVSPDGNAVVWVKGDYPAGDVWRAERTAGAWGAPEQVTGADGTKSLPATNGPVTVYGSNAGGDDNIRWSVKDESGVYVESVLELPGDQRNPNIAGNLISFESNTGPATQFDIYTYDLATNRLYQLTDTSISETLSDVTIGTGGLVRLVWAQPKQVYPYDMDVYAMSFLVDNTSPVITPDIYGTQGQNGWYIGDVSLTWSVTEDLSQITDESGCDPVAISSDQASTQYTCSATSSGGTNSETATIKRDGTRPVTSVNNVMEGAIYLLGSEPQAVCSSTDNLSGMAAEATLALTGGDVQGVGTITATCSGALDAAGNAADPAVVHYTVNIPSNIYSFTGFFQPVDNWPTENMLKAGAGVPIKFSLGGDMGLAVLADGSPTSRQVICPSSSAATADAIEETTTSNSGLTYDEASSQYVYVWKTNKTWANTCRIFTIIFADGSSQQALFKFSK